MATDEASDQLSRRQIVRLPSAISADNMESIAEGYMDISDATIKNIRRDASNSEAFNRDVIRHWMYKNPDNQVQVSNQNGHLIYFPITRHWCPRPRRKILDPPLAKGSVTLSVRSVCLSVCFGCNL